MALPRIDIGLKRDERLPVALLLLLFLTLCVVGGASREDVLAQAVIRGCALLVMLVQIAAGRLPEWRRYRACSLLLGSMIIVAALQLVPLPPMIWTALPGRSLITASPLGAEGWRPLSLVPDATWNSLFSLLVPLSVLFLLSSIEVRTARRAHYLLIGAVVFSAIVALFQAAGSAPENPLINGTTTDYAGIFANRNHQALFLAVGIAGTWFWGFRRGGDLRDRRLWLAVCIVLLLSISILVTGSRSGIIVGVAAIVAGPVLARASQRQPSGSKAGVLLWTALSFAIVGGVLVLGSYFGRAESVDRVAALSLDSDFRMRALPTVWQIAQTYLPFGAGLGSFDNVFRVVEPFSLLEPTYFNHAHNDFLETVIETGIFGPIIFFSAGVWALRRLIGTFSERGEGAKTARMGALIIGLVVIASVSDYPARTPMIMAVLMVAACWLAGTSSQYESDPTGSALPSNDKFL